MILDTNAFSAYLDQAPAAVEVVTEAREVAGAGTPLPANDVWIAALSRSMRRL